MTEEEYVANLFQQEHRPHHFVFREEMYLTVAQMCDDTMLGSPGKLIAGLNVVEFINKVR